MTQCEEYGEITTLCTRVLALKNVMKIVSTV
jgi:hypothetical protein